jgi:V/A-type H+-transporting ATPase subunit C
LTAFFSLGERTAVGAKAHVLYSQLLKDEEWWALMACDDVPEIAAHLGRTAGYGEALSTLVPKEATRVQLEDRLKLIPARRAGSFLPYLTGARRRLLAAWIERTQATALKKALRFVLTKHGDREAIRSRIADLPFQTLPFDLLLSSRDFTDFSEALRGTPYFGPLREPLKRLAGGEENLFPAEAAIDTAVLVALYRAAEALSAGERGPVMRVLGVRFDMLNISWIYRSLRYFDLTPEERIARLLPCRYRLQAGSLRKMARSADLEEFWPVMKSTVYGAAFAESPPTEEMAMDRDLRRFILKTAERVFRRGSPDLSTLIAYLTLLESEVTDLTTLIEDVRYDYDRRHAALFLARPLIPGGEVRWQS